jgi:hypothetical protein
MSALHNIHVYAKAENLLWANIIPILENIFPVKFNILGKCETYTAEKINVEELLEESTNRNGGVISLKVLNNSNSPRLNKTPDVMVKFTNDDNVPFPFRGRSVRAKFTTGVKILSLYGNEKLLASSDQGPIWAVSENGTSKQFRSGLTLPGIPPGGNFHDIFNGERFLEMIPLLHWLREICENDLYEGPPLRACFMFDDPNLHRPRYGFVDYQKIATHATKENYHVSFATIPLDTWFTHKATAEIFKQNVRQLSLLVHGNNHTKRELAQTYTPINRVSLLQQALRRVERLEQKTGVKVSRVMVPPHGACSHEILEDLPRNGFESACISHGSLRAHNPSRPWTRQLGYLPSEMIADCPVLPRWGLANSSENTIWLATYLHQPIILRGHHQDLKDGLELLDEFARKVNNLGDVIWSNMTDISRLNYAWRMDGDVIRIKPWAWKLNVQVPKEARTLLVEPVVGQNWNKWRILHADGSVVEFHRDEAISLLIWSDKCIVLEAIMSPVTQHELNGTPLPIAVYIRRILTEGRDRLVGAFGS